MPPNQPDDTKSGTVPPQSGEADTIFSFTPQTTILLVTDTS